MEKLALVSFLNYGKYFKKSKCDSILLYKQPSNLHFLKIILHNVYNIHVPIITYWNYEILIQI
jgi:hypothetical protein